MDTKEKIENVLEKINQWGKLGFDRQEIDRELWKMDLFLWGKRPSNPASQEQISHGNSWFSGRFLYVVAYQYWAPSNEFRYCVSKMCPWRHNELDYFPSEWFPVPQD